MDCHFESICESCTFFEDNAVTRRAAERWGGRVVKRYRLYEGPV